LLQTWACQFAAFNLPHSICRIHFAAFMTMGLRWFQPWMRTSRVQRAEQKAFLTDVSRCETAEIAE
jgi:hypothetical protein